MSTLITVLHVIVCLFLMLTVLLQSGKGGGMGAAFGGGNAATVFGASGASGFLKKATAVAGTIFMVTSMVLAFIASHNSADALEKFGEEQQKLADEKEKAKENALKDAKSGSAADSAAGSAAGSGMIPLTPTTPDPAGSGATAPGNPGGGQTGSAPTPAEMPIPAGKTDAHPNPSTPAGMSPPGGAPAAGSAAKPAAPASGSAAKPAAPKPATPAPKPATPAAGSAAKPAPATPAPATTPAPAKPAEGSAAPSP